MKTLQLGQTYPTRDGKGSGLVVHVSMKSKYPVLVVMAYNGVIDDSYQYLANGVYDADEPDGPMDLIIPERKMRTVYASMWPRSDAGGACGVLYDSDDSNRYPVEVPAE